MSLEILEESQNELQQELQEVPLDQIDVNPFQPRRKFTRTELEELANSIRSVGILHPPLVRPKEGESDQYELVSGERRLRAAELAGLKKIPVVIRSNGITPSSENPSQVSAEAALIENIQRVDLNPLEVAKALRSLVDEFHLDQETLAERLGKKRSTVANYLRLLSLPKAIQESLTHDQITMGHAKAILSLKGFEKQQLLHELILRDDLSVREAEEASRRIAEREKKKNLVYAPRNFYLEQLAEKVQEKLGTKVAIHGKGKRGRISIDYYGLDDLDRLLELFGVKDD